LIKIVARASKTKLLKIEVGLMKEVFVNCSFVHYEHFHSAPSRWVLRSAPDSGKAKKKCF